MTAIDTDEVMLRFTELMDLSIPQWLEVVKKLKSADYPSGCCPTHDYCDANMVMQDVFERLGIPIYTKKGQMREKVRLAWNDAWDKAHKYWITKNWASEEEKEVSA